MKDEYGAYTGQTSMENHEEHYYTQHFRKRAAVLTIAHRGFAKNGHVVLNGPWKKGWSNGELVRTWAVDSKG